MNIFDAGNIRVKGSQFRITSDSPAATNSFEVFDVNYGFGFAVEGVYGRTKFGTTYTTSPATIMITDYGTVQRYINFEADGSHGFFSRASTGLIFTGLDTVDGLQFTLNSDLSLSDVTAYFKNKVGIGALSPSDSLQIGGIAGTGTMNMNGGGGVGSTLSVRGHSATGYQFDMYNSDFSRAYFLAQQDGTGPGTNASLQMMFRSGTGSAITGYDIDGKLRVGFGGNYSGDGALLHTRHDFKSTGSDALFSWTDTLNYILIDSPKGVTEAQPFIEIVGGSGGANVGHLKLSTTQDSYIAVAEFGTVGNFGVGTSSPAYKLDTLGRTRLNGGVLIGATETGGYITSGDHKMQVLGDSPLQSLMTFIGGDGNIQIWNDTTPSKAWSWGLAVPGVPAASPPVYDYIVSAWQPSWIETFRIVNDTGFVGVNNSDPTARLHVIGSDGTSFHSFNSNPSGGAIGGIFEVADPGGLGGLILVGRGDASIERFRVTTEGLWGIGTSSPDATLHVVGSMKFKGVSAGYTGSEKVEKQDGIQTTNTTPTTIATIATTSDEVTIVKGYVAGLSDGSDSPPFSESYGSNYFAVFRNTGGTLVQVSTTDLNEKYDFGSGTPTTSFTTSGTNILLQVTGVSGITINWVATYEYSKVKTNS